MIQAGAGPSGIGTEPTGWMLGSAAAGAGQPIAAVPIVTAPTMTAMDADTAALSLPMAAYPNPFAAVPSAGVESTHDELGRNL